MNGGAPPPWGVGDTVIVISYATMPDAEAKAYLPKVVFVDAANQIVHTGADPAYPGILPG